MYRSIWTTVVGFQRQILLYPLLQMHDFKTPSYDYYCREMRDTAFVDPRLVAQYYLMYGGIDDQTNARLAPIALENKHVSPEDRKIFEQHFDIKRLPEEFKFVFLSFLGLFFCSFPYFFNFVCLFSNNRSVFCSFF